MSGHALGTVFEASSANCVVLRILPQSLAAEAIRSHLAVHRSDATDPHEEHGTSWQYPQHRGPHQVP